MLTPPPHSTQPASGLWLRHLTDSAPRFLERYPYHVFWCLSILYFAGALATAQHRPLWHDELYTYHVTRIGTFAGLWHALLEGVDVTPPLFNIITRLSTLLLGSDEIGLRMPAIIGFWVFLGSIFWYVHKQASTVLASLAMCLPLVTYARTYATEARPYGLLLAFSGLSLYFWQAAAAKNRNRTGVLLALAASLAAAVSVHYYAVTIIFPLLLGELVRSIKRRRIDYALATTFVLPAILLALHWPLIETAMTYSGGDWSRTTLTSLAASYRELFRPAETLLAPLVISAILVIALAPPRNSLNTPGWNLAFHEKWVLGAFLSLPLLAYLVAVGSNGIFTPRYAIATSLGYALLAAWGVSLLNRRWPAAAPVLLAVLLCWIGIAQLRALARIVLRPASLAAVKTLTSASDTGMIAVADPHLYMQLLHYSPSTVTGRLRYLFQSGVQDDERTLVLLQRLAPVRLKTLHELDPAKERFSLFVTEASLYVTSALEQKGFRLFPQATTSQGDLFEVRPGDMSALEPFAGNNP